MQGAALCHSGGRLLLENGPGRQKLVQSVPFNVHVDRFRDVNVFHDSLTTKGRFDITGFGADTAEIRSGRDALLLVKRKSTVQIALGLLDEEGVDAQIFGDPVQTLLLRCGASCQEGKWGKGDQDTHGK